MIGIKRPDSYTRSTIGNCHNHNYMNHTLDMFPSTSSAKVALRIRGGKQNNMECGDACSRWWDVRRGACSARQVTVATNMLHYAHECRVWRAVNQSNCIRSNRDADRYGDGATASAFNNQRHRLLMKSTCFHANTRLSQSSHQLRLARWHLWRGHVNFKKKLKSKNFVECVQLEIKKIGKHIFIHYFITFLGEHLNVNNVINALLCLCSCFYVQPWLITFEIFLNFFGWVGG